jgi:hypothetical protein
MMCFNPGEAVDSKSLQRQMPVAMMMMMMMRMMMMMIIMRGRRRRRKRRIRMALLATHLGIEALSNGMLLV